MKSFVDEFKAFAMKGNVVDLAVAVIIGVAFGKIVSSLVDNIIMPIVGIFLGGMDFTSMSVQIGDAYVSYGVFLQNVVDFVIVALVIFLVVKAINKTKEINKDESSEKDSPAEPSEEVKILREIRDSLKHSHHSH